MPQRSAKAVCLELEDVPQGESIILIAYRVARLEWADKGARESYALTLTITGAPPATWVTNTVQIGISSEQFCSDLST
ncbi:hypothetical protein OAG75_00285, partial [bacterium]|nr:hypothetical protein [bacterium]